MSEVTKEYPAVITPDLLAAYAAHISDAEVARDIADTEQEIRDLTRTMEAEESLAKHHPHSGERRLADFRAAGRSSQISQREAFIAFLRRLQDARAAVTP